MTPLSVDIRHIFGRFNQAPIVYGFLLTVVFVGLIAFTVWHSRDVALRNAANELTRINLMLAEHTVGRLEGIDLALTTMIDHVRALGDLEQTDERAIRDVLAERSSSLSEHQGAFYVNPDGIVRATTRVFPALRNSVADRPYFTAHRDDPRPGLKISAPFKIPGTELWSINFSRRLDGPVGEFRGVIAISLSPAHFVKLFEALGLHLGSAITLLMRDGTVLARYPHNEQIIGRTFGGGPLLQMLATTDHAVQRQISPIDGHARIVSTRALSRLPLVVNASVEVSDVLRDWWGQASLLVIAAVLAVLVLAGFIMVLVRQLALQQRQAAMLNTTNAELSRRIDETRVKSRFIATAGHDLRQPLHALTLFVSALQRRVDGAEARQIVASMGTAVRSMQAMFNALLDVSKLDAGIIAPTMATVPVAQVLEACIGEFQAQAAARGLQLRIVPTRAVVQTDPVLLESILRNLITNAVKFTPRGHILVGCRRRGDRLAIEVWDTGIGIPASKCEAIFEEFQRLDDPQTRREQGLGLGLAIVRRTATLLDARIEVRSVVGKGSCFAVLVPLVDAQADVPSRPVGEPNDRGFQGLTVLAVENDPAVLTALSRELADWGCRVITATSAEAAMDQTRRLRDAPDFMIVDLALGGEMTGADFVGRVSDLFGADVPALIITGSTDLATQDTLRKSGLTWMTKPVDPAVLRAAFAAELSK